MFFALLFIEDIVIQFQQTVLCFFLFFGKCVIGFILRYRKLLKHFHDGIYILTFNVFFRFYVCMTTPIIESE